MFVPHEALNWAHLNSAMLRSGTDRNQRRLVIEETEECIGRVLLAYGTPLMAVYLFRYLGQMLLSSDDDYPAVGWNIRRARGKWGRPEKILGREGVDKRTVGSFYVVVAQAVLFWV